MDKSHADIISNWDEAVDSFDALDLKSDLIRGIYGNLSSRLL